MEETTIVIEYYKDTGKWYTTYEEVLPSTISSWDENEVIKWIKKQKFHKIHMPFTFETNSTTSGMNKRLVLC